MENISQVFEDLSNENSINLIEKSSITIANAIKKCLEEGKLITIFGNGGSAADSQHWAGELVCTYKNKTRESIPAIALTSNSAIVTAWANDESFEDVFCRQLRAFRRFNGLSIGMSTSGRSINVRKALEVASEQDAGTILISGNGCPLYQKLGLHVRLPSNQTPIIQTLTQMLYHRVCDRLE